MQTTVLQKHHRERMRSMTWHHGCDETTRWGCTAPGQRKTATRRLASQRPPIGLPGFESRHWILQTVGCAIRWVLCAPCITCLHAWSHGSVRRCDMDNATLDFTGVGVRDGRAVLRNVERRIGTVSAVTDMLQMRADRDVGRNFVTDCRSFNISSNSSLIDPNKSQ